MGLRLLEGWVVEQKNIKNLQSTQQYQFTSYKQDIHIYIYIYIYACWKQINMCIWVSFKTRYPAQSTVLTSASDFWIPNPSLQQSQTGHGAAKPTVEGQSVNQSPLGQPCNLHVLWIHRYSTRPLNSWGCRASHLSNPQPRADNFRAKGLQGSFKNKWPLPN